MNKKSDIRPSPLAGRWYPANPNTLAEGVDHYIQQADVPDLPGSIIALVSPHAGHQFSGPVAGYCFAALRGLTPDLVVILSPYHQFHTGAILTSTHQAYQTPLGTVPIDREKLDMIDQQLQEREGISLTRISRDSEHAVEILLPFFQRVLENDFQFIPLMIRQQDPQLMKSLGAILANLLKSNHVLLTASTDLSHFFPAEEAAKMDQTVIKHIKSLNPERLYQAQNTGSGSACGVGALAAVIWAASAEGNAVAHHLHYAHSGDITGDHSSVVGYAAAVITRE
jgi:AmmeMemoRadiSam system protein B